MGATMSSYRHSAITKYVRSLVSLMNLSHYTVLVDKNYTDTDEDGTEVYALCVPGINTATLMVLFSNAFFDETSREDQRNTVCHELIHAHVDPLMQHIFGSESIRELIGTPVFTVLEESANNIMERMVDQMANGWSITLPLPGRIPK